MNAFANADDINFASTPVPRLHCLIYISTNYAENWHFKFGLEKTKCLLPSAYPFKHEPSLTLKGHQTDNVWSMEVLDVHFG